ncbi:C10 family peptidase [Anaerobaca lacustris]|uniref:C10 family peptidase n=1 Tax=Anaerobaca lacustris TaxID=3044600 RepID=A0AAW6TWB3_9BACT|nr:C10 family peptidase [Sedimentisphaerales bacterium M17dextr]
MNFAVHRRIAGILFVCACLLRGSVLWAEPVLPEQARKATSAFLRIREARPSKASPWMASPERGIPMSIEPAASDGAPYAIRDADGTVLAYVIELEPEGFVVTSADTDITPIVAYSFRSAFADWADVRHPLYGLLTEDMRRRVAARGQSDPSRAVLSNAQWAAYSGQGAPMARGQTFQQWPVEGSTSTGGWLETTWHQDAPYNAFCPLDPVDGLRSYVGCVATAMAQVVHYHRQCNVVFTADDSYTTVNGIDIDGDGVRYDFPSFDELNASLAMVRLRYETQTALDDADLAALNFACGIAARMDYSSEGSGAAAYDMRMGLVEKFGFHSADLIGDLSQQTVQLLHENLTNRLPAILGIHAPDGMAGHAIVCDGYNTDGEYHLNFGWGRFYPDRIAEAWYRLPVDIPASLNAISSVLVNVRPTPADIDVRPTALTFRGVPGQASEPFTLSLKSNGSEVLAIDSIESPDGFVVSHAGGQYANRIGAFQMPPGQEAAVDVRFAPESAGAYYGMLIVHYDGKVKFVPLDGAAISGGTQIAPGEVSGTWSEAESPYYVLGDIDVAQGGELVVEPGVRIVFMGSYGLTVGQGARLQAQGTAARPVEFTAGNREMGWEGIRFVASGDDDVLSHCAITYAKKGTAGVISAEASTADPFGGAICCYNSSPTITHCKITNNTCDKAGAIYCYGSSAVISNTLIANNTSIGGVPQSGGIVCDRGSAVRIDNCTIVYNAPGGIFSESEYGTEVTNTIVWGNSEYQIQTYASEVAASFSNVQGGYPGRENIDGQPCFVGPSNGAGAHHDASMANWTLQTCSACINAGSENASGDIDLGGNTRVHSGLVDIGAYENQLDLPLLGLRPSGAAEFGCVAVGADAVTTVTMANTGKVDFEISSLSISDARGVFSLLDPVHNHTLSPGQSIQVRIGFAPDRERVYSGLLHVVSTSSNASYRRLVLWGVGGSGTLVPGGSVAGVWTKAAGPYTVTGDIEVPAGQTLTVEPGVVVKFAGRFGLTVGRNATLRALGTEADPILFTAIDTIEGWFGIRFVHSGDDDVLRYCRLQYAGKPYNGAADFVDLLGGAVLCCKGRDPRTGGMTAGPASSPTIDRCVFSGNHALSGGAIACHDDSQAVITNNTIADNTADWDGGGIHIYNADPVIGNNVIARNGAYRGGGLYSVYSYPLVVNNTIARNRPNGMHLDSTRGLGRRASVLSNIVWENEIYVRPSVPAVQYDVRFNNIQGGWPGEGNIEADPLFADSARGDYHLKSAAGRWDPQAGDWVPDEATSPCIDTGDPFGATGDEPEPNGGRINMGAYGGTSQASKSP